MVGLGDSQVAGSGSAVEIYRDRDSDAGARYDGSCFVSRYSPVTAAAQAIGATSQNLACLGATTEDVVAHQLNRIPYETDVVVISAGANNILEHIFDDTCLWNQHECLASLTTALHQDSGSVERAVGTTLEAVRNRIKPSGRIVALGLIDPWPDASTLWCYPGFDDVGLTEIRHQFALINRILRIAALTTGVEFLDPQNVLTGQQRPCRSDSAFDDLTWPNLAVQGFGPGLDVFGHLTRDGNELLGRAVGQLIRETPLPTLTAPGPSAETASQAKTLTSEPLSPARPVAPHRGLGTVALSVRPIR